MAETFMSSLDPAAAEELRAASAERSYPARSYIFHHGDPGGSVLVVKSGLLRVDRTAASGRTTLLELAIQGDLIGELSVLDGISRSASLSTVTPVVVRSIPGARFLDLLDQNPSLHMAVTHRLAHRLRSLSAQFLETATLDAPARMAARLVRLVEIEQTLGRISEHVSEPIDLKLPISQEELGQWSGLTREGAVIGLSTLRSVGTIETGRMRVRILDLGKLRDWR